VRWERAVKRRPRQASLKHWRTSVGDIRLVNLPEFLYLRSCSLLQCKVDSCDTHIAEVSGTDVSCRGSASKLGMRQFGLQIAHLSFSNIVLKAQWPLWISMHI